jgi:membrane fusion protein (multidrug efflux system)
MTQQEANIQETAPAATQRMSGKARLATVTAVAAGVALLAYGGYWWTTGRYIEKTDDAYVSGDITVVSPKVPGYIKTVTVRDNQFVHAGDIVVQLDDRDYRAALEKAEAAVSAQHALIANLDATRALQQAVIAQARAGVDVAAAERSRAQEDARRYERLVAHAAVSAESALRAATDAKQAQANEQKAQAAQTAAERELAVIATRRQQAEAALSQAMAERDIAKLNLGYTELRAPIDGTVGNRRARAGAYAAASAQMLVIVPAHGLWVDANFKESQLEHIRPGLPATIEVDAIPGHRFQGRVLSVAPATGAQFSVLPPENATGNFTKIVQRVPVRIALDEKSGGDAMRLLRAGLSVVAEVDARGARDARDTLDGNGSPRRNDSIGKDY